MQGLFVEQYKTGVRSQEPGVRSQKSEVRIYKPQRRGGRKEKHIDDLTNFKENKREEMQEKK